MRATVTLNWDLQIPEFPLTVWVRCHFPSLAFCGAKLGVLLLWVAS